jgi:hypothetical protein
MRVYMWQTGRLCNITTAMRRTLLQIAKEVREENASGWTDRYGNEPRKGSDVLVQVRALRASGHRCSPSPPGLHCALRVLPATR